MLDDLLKNGYCYTHCDLLWSRRDFTSKIVELLELAEIGHVKAKNRFGNMVVLQESVEVTLGANSAFLDGIEKLSDLTTPKNLAA